MSQVHTSTPGSLADFAQLWRRCALTSVEQVALFTCSESKKDKTLASCARGTMRCVCRALRTVPQRIPKEVPP